MAWIEITPAFVLAKLSGPEVERLNAAALGDGQTDPLAEIIADVVEVVRGRVAANRQNALGAGATVPSELKSQTLAIIRGEFLTRIPGLKALLTPERKDAWDKALDDLRDAAKGLIAIEAPDEASDQVIPGPSTQLISSRDRLSTRQKMEGL